MPVLCRLCVETCNENEFKGLYDESGSSNEVYETTFKYFDPMIFVNLELEKPSVICLLCWTHIYDFNEFQLKVIQAQTKVAIKQDIKTEEEVDEYPFEQLEKEQKDNILDANPIVEEDDKSDLLIPTFPDLELFDTHHHDQFSSDDDKPLMECASKTWTTRRKKVKTNRKEKAASRNVGSRKRGRKSKSEVDKKRKNEERADTDTSSKNVVGTIASDDNISDVDRKDLSDGKMFKHSTKARQRSKEIDDFIAQWKQDLECVICSQSYPNLTLLRKHFRDTHPKEQCYISCCQRKLRHRFHIEEHIRFHIDPNAFKCDQCEKCCTNSRNLNNHKLEKHTKEGQQRSFECPVCKKCFAKKTVLKCHLDIHKTGTDFICNECGKGFPTEQKRKVHERMVHNVDRVCDQCGKTIHGIYALKQHILEHAGIKKPKWPCDLCNAQLYSHSSLKRHKQVAHHDGSTVYVCSECGKVAPTETALRSHKKYVHQAERKHKCNICDKAFKVAVVLREHMATHTGEDLYTCPHCPKTFKVSANMHHHRKKAHFAEWAEGRLNKPLSSKVDVNKVSNEVVL